MPRRTPRGRHRERIANQLTQSLRRADALISNQQFETVADLLGDLDRRFPNQPDVIGRQLNLALATDDLSAYVLAAERLVRLLPDDPEMALALASGYLGTQRIAQAQRAFADFAQRWPSHEHAAEARSQAEALSTALDILWADLAFEGPADHELLADHERVQGLLAGGHWQQAIDHAEHALRRHPEFVSIRNNLSLAYHNNGQSDQAIAAAREVLATERNNVHALGNLTRFLVLDGQLDEAGRYARRLKAVPIDTPDTAVKQAEALSFIGDDDGVLDAFDRVQKRKNRDDDPGASALLHHLAAVAAMRLGRTQAARRRWQKALELQPNFELALENVADLDLPEDERNAPWPYSLEYWQPRSVIEDLLHALQLNAEPDDQTMMRIAQRYLERHPALVALVPLLLDRGDPRGREFALRLAGMAQTPELLTALRDFALGKRGPLDLRMQAAQIAMHAGILPNGSVRFWRAGAWHETLMFGFEIHDEPSVPTLPTQVLKLHREAALALRAGDPASSERLLLQALTLAPDEPSLLNNLGATYGALGRGQEAEALAERLFAKHPDYLFARTNLVAYLVAEGKIEEAQALIDPLLQRTRLHISEFGAVMGSQINIFIAQGNRTAAQTWLDMWQQADPDHPHIQLYQSRLLFARRRRRARKQ